MNGERIEEARVVYGGVAPVVLRLAKTEAHLTGKSALLETFEQAGQIAKSEITPISDVRGSRDYRLQLAENILSRCWFDLFGELTSSTEGSSQLQPRLYAGGPSSSSAP